MLLLVGVDGMYLRNCKADIIICDTKIVRRPATYVTTKNQDGAQIFPRAVQCMWTIRQMFCIICRTAEE